MPLVVAPEEGFDSYASLAEADAYFLERADAAWAAATEVQRNNALRVGSVYIAAKRLVLQAWYPTVLRQVKFATMEAAKLALTGGLYKASTQAVIEKSVGPLTLRYAPPTGGEVFNRYPFIDDLLLGLTMTGRGPVFFERV